MGVPVTRECAFQGCEALSTDFAAKEKGVYFDVTVLFTPRSARRGNSGGELWACCKSHKAAAIREVLKDMPFLSIAADAAGRCDVPEQLSAEA